MNRDFHNRKRMHKTHGDFEPQPNRGAYILREPNGAPNVLLISNLTAQNALFAAANILSVQGFTARVVIVENAALFLSQSSEYHNGIFSDYPCVRVGLADAETAKIATRFAIHCLAAISSAAEIARTAVSLLKENK